VAATTLRENSLAMDWIMTCSSVSLKDIAISKIKVKADAAIAAGQG
jgi:hypothetical protein